MRDRRHCSSICLFIHTESTHVSDRKVLFSCLNQSDPVFVVDQDIAVDCECEEKECDAANDHKTDNSSGVCELDKLFAQLVGEERICLFRKRYEKNIANK